MQQMFCIHQQIIFQVPMIKLYVEFEQHLGLDVIGEKVNMDELEDINWDEDNNHNEKNSKPTTKSMAKTMTKTRHAILQCKIKQLQLSTSTSMVFRLLCEL
ncbi:uncharacterized protein DS421_3g88930 [Arachis hypogaea]|nr:uncharacterized protein DS421_3g88930 [Arachis hypogaea]